MTTPLLPAHIDLRGMPWMPLDTVRLIDSDLFALSTGDEFKAAVALWCKSWTQVPAASLPNDDRILAHLSGTSSRWKRIKAMAMRGWVLCEDNRFYHPVIAEKALEAWKEREEFQDRQENESTRLQNFRAEHKALRKALREQGVVLPFDTKIDVLRARVAEFQAAKAETETETATETKTFQDGNASNALEMQLQWLRQGQGQGQGYIKPKSGSEARVPALPPELAEKVTAERWQAYCDQLVEDGKLSIARIKTAHLQLAGVIQNRQDPNAVLEAAVMRGLRDLTDTAQRLANEAGRTNGASNAAHQSGRGSGHKLSASERVQQAIAERQAREQRAGDVIEGTFTPINP